VLHEEPAPSRDAEPTFVGESDDAVVVREHEALMIPEDAGFKRSPFVDGAIVRFVPESTDDGAEGGPVWIASVPERPLDRSLADPSLLAHVLVHKLDYHTPYYRQEVGSARYGFRLGRANMARWQFECGGIVTRIADAMWTDALSRSWFAMDATGTAIRAKEKNRYGHVFVLVAPGDGVMFRYTPTYDGPTVEKLFGGYLGTLVADASANHNVLFGPGKQHRLAAGLAPARGGVTATNVLPAVDPDRLSAFTPLSRGPPRRARPPPCRPPPPLGASRRADARRYRHDSAQISTHQTFVIYHTFATCRCGGRFESTAC
jgi:hypothetical protein